MLTGPKGKTALGCITDLGCDREVDGARDDRDLVKLRFRSTDDLERGDLRAFLAEHLAGLNGDGAESGGSKFNAGSDDA